jgi:hypothetical protein
VTRLRAARYAGQGGPDGRADHYSYSVYADPAMAEAFDSLRFSGPIGRLIAQTQEQVVASFLAPVRREDHPGRGNRHGTRRGLRSPRDAPE